jgi:xanthosine utilization system XapX-like protein
MDKSRAELEARLQSASDSMSRRLTAMEDEVKLPAVVKLAKVAGGGRAKKIGFAIGAGLLVGLLFGGGKKKSNSKADADSQGLIGFVLGQAVRVGVTVAAKEIVNRLMSRNGEQEDS